MERLFYIILLLKVSTYSLIGQVFTLGYGVTYFAHKSKTKLHPEITGKRSGNDDVFNKVQYEHVITNKIIISRAYSQYPIYTLFDFYKKNEGGSIGWNGTNVERIDMCILYNVFHKSKIFVYPSIGLGFQKSIPNGQDIIGGDISEGIKPDNFELLRPIESFAYSNTQIVPIVGLKFGYAFWGRLEFYLDIQQVFGFRTIQELRMNYTYKGIEQPEAIKYSDGTARFWAFGLGYRFVQLNKIKIKKKL